MQEAILTKRSDGRAATEIRPITFNTGASRYAEGSVEASFGHTKLLITATIEDGQPAWMSPDQGGWITAEYGMLPRATHSRNRREATLGKQSGRTLEIQRLIGRALRQAIVLKELGPITIRLDCDVLCADGGTRTAAISAGWVALWHAVQQAKDRQLVPPALSVKQIAAISMGIVDGQPRVDLDYEEDSRADFDCNLVVTEELEIIEIQGTAERQVITQTSLWELIEYARPALKVILDAQRLAATR